MTDLTNFLDRKSLVIDRTEITDEVLEVLYELSEEDVNFDSLEKFTDKKFRELSENEKTELIKNLESADYKKYKNCYISTSKLLYEKSDTLIKEIKALNVLNDLGYSVYLLPFGYARNNQNFLQKSADSITNHQFLEFKNIVSEGKNAGYSAYKESRHQLYKINKEGETEKINISDFGLKNTRELKNNSQVEELFSNKLHPLPRNNVTSQFNSVNNSESVSNITANNSVLPESVLIGAYYESRMSDYLSEHNEKNPFDATKIIMREMSATKRKSLYLYFKDKNIDTKEKFDAYLKNTFCSSAEKKELKKNKSKDSDYGYGR